MWKIGENARRLAGPLGRLWQGTAAWRRRGLRLLYPPRCALCDADLGADHEAPLLCFVCRDAMGPRQESGCPRCGAPVPAVSGQRCPLCRDQEFQFDAVVPLGVYRDRLAQAVLRMKRQSNGSLAAAMGGFYLQTRGEELAALRPDFALPVPMFWMTRLLRKVNSPDVLAVTIARGLRTPVFLRMLRRVRKTRPQKSLPPRERFRNVAGSFALQQGYDIEGARVLLVDDVMTTGATSDAAARVLKQAGAAHVAVAVLARGVGNQGA